MFGWLKSSQQRANYLRFSAHRNPPASIHLMDHWTTDSTIRPFDHLPNWPNDPGRNMFLLFLFVLLVILLVIRYENDINYWHSNYHQWWSMHQKMRHSFTPTTTRPHPYMAYFFITWEEDARMGHSVMEERWCQHPTPLNHWDMCHRHIFRSITIRLPIISYGFLSS